jgi:hypothetical protein
VAHGAVIELLSVHLKCSRAVHFPANETSFNPHPEEAAISAFTRVFNALWRPSRRMQARLWPSWFETRFALLTMRVQTSILAAKSPAFAAISCDQASSFSRDVYTAELC